MEREELLQLYKKEKDPNVKDRLMLNIRVRFENHSITEAAHSLGKVTSWGSKWYRRFAKAGLEGLQNLPRSGRPTQITGEETAGIRKGMDGRQYWTVGGARELISKVTGVTYSVSSVYKMLRRWGVLPQGAGKAARAQAARRGDRQVPEGARRTDTEEDRGGLHGGRAGRDNRYRRRPAQEGLHQEGEARRLHHYRLAREDGGLRPADHGRQGHVRAVRQVHHGEFCRLSEEGPPEVPEDGNDTGQGAAAHG